MSVSGGAPQLIGAGVWLGGYWDQKNELELMSDLSIPEGIIHKQGDTLNTAQEFEDKLREYSQNPTLLPGGKAILLTRRPGPRNRELGVLSLETGEYQALVDRGANARYVSTGHLIYALGGELLAAPFDLGRLKITGPSVTVVENDQSDLYDAIKFSISENGTLVYVRGSGKNQEFSIEWVNHQGAHSISPDGQRFAIVEASDKTGLDILILNLEGDSTAQPFLRTDADEFHPSFSPDGHWLAYTSDLSGRNEIYVRPYPGPGAVVQISRDGGYVPVWNPVKKELYYRQDKKMMAVTYQTEPTFQVINTKQRFESDHNLSNDAFQRSYDISPDGRRFLMIRENATKRAPTQIHVVVNWFEELKAKMATVE